MNRKHSAEKKHMDDHRCYFKIGGICFLVESDIPFEESTFSSTIKKFIVSKPDDDLVHISHHFNIPAIKGKDYGPQVSGEDMFQIYRRNNISVYIASDPPYNPLKNPGCIRVVAFFKNCHTRSHIYHRDETYFREGNSNSIFFVGPDQLFISLLLADRKGCYLHSSGINFENNGFIFLGHSGAGKSTISKLLSRDSRLLCDDRIIVRRWPEGFKIHGTWSHGELSDVSPESVPLQAILFISKDNENFVVPLKTKKDILLRLLECLIVPVATSDWWRKIFDLFDNIIAEIPCYELHFNKTGGISKLMRSLCK